MAENENKQAECCSRGFQAHECEEVQEEVQTQTAESGTCFL